jgi:hypothetical protein
MPRFVILKHCLPAGHARPTHFDFMLQQGDVLWTWALPSLPDAEGCIDAERLADHRVAYLNYEGEVSGNRGSVTRIDEGEFSWLQCDETAGRLLLELRGRVVCGKMSLMRLADQRWTCSFSAA